MQMTNIINNNAIKNPLVEANGVGGSMNVQDTLINGYVGDNSMPAEACNDTFYGNSARHRNNDDAILTCSWRWRICNGVPTRLSMSWLFHPTENAQARRRLENGHELKQDGDGNPDQNMTAP